jgi:hypothetical protein
MVASRCKVCPSHTVHYPSNWRIYISPKHAVEKPRKYTKPDRRQDCSDNISHRQKLLSDWQPPIAATKIALVNIFPSIQLVSDVDEERPARASASFAATEARSLSMRRLLKPMTAFGRSLGAPVK